MQCRRTQWLLILLCANLMLLCRILYSTVDLDEAWTLLLCVPYATWTTRWTMAVNSDLSKAEMLEQMADWKVYVPADPTLPTIALETPLDGGFRNQCMVLTWLVMEALERNATQILLPSISFMDFLGTNQRVPFERLFDVQHWNSHYPALPRLVSHHATLHPQWDLHAQRFVVLRRGSSSRRPNLTYTHPQALSGSAASLIAHYINYTQRVSYSDGTTVKHPADLLIQKGALRPHPDLQKHIDRLRQLKVLRRKNLSAAAPQQGDNSYMALHARVEPDVWFHRGVPNDRKLVNLTKLLEMIQEHWPEPPAPVLFIAINRELMQDRPYLRDFPNRSENLEALNRAVEQGLWGGRVRVVEGGVRSLESTPFRDRPVVFASVVDYALAVESEVFVGTLMSGFSMNVVQTRFWAKNTTENYDYGPGGIMRSTTHSAKSPPAFRNP